MNDRWVVEIDGRDVGPGPENNYVSYYPAELSWAPDSRAFYLTQSDATSEIDGFHTEAYRVNEQGVEQLPNLDRTVHEQLDHRHDCLQSFQGKRYNENRSNVAGLGWVDGSDRILLVTEIVPDSDCGPRGYFGGYLLSTTDGRVLHAYSPHELAEHWGTVLGARLKGGLRGLEPSGKGYQAVDVAEEFTQVCFSFNNQQSKINNSS
ncbi:MAG: hypothetical protein ACLQBK_17155 [Candidatus Sulfotelmatobacter sp.]